MFNDKLVRYIHETIEAFLRRWPFDIRMATGQLPTTSLPPGGDTGDGFSPAPHAHLEFYDAHKFYGRPISSAVPQDGEAFIWSDADTMFVLGAAGGGGAAAFKAQLAADFDMDGGNLYVLPTTTELYDLGGLFDSSADVYSWTPPAGPVAFMYRLRMSTNSQDVTTYLSKNGATAYTKTGGRYSYLGSGWVESTFFDLASGSDTYQLKVHVDDDATLLSSDSWWAGMVGGGGGGGGGTGGPIGPPAPFVYMVDSDGVLLVDSDGRYLYEDL